MIFLPCGHSIDVEALDEHFGITEFYTVATSGCVQSVLIAGDATENSYCPVCEVSFEGRDIPRYSIGNQLKQFSDTVDRMIAKIGRKTDALGRQILGHEMELKGSFKSFCEGIRPNPLAAKENQRLVHDRVETLLRIQTQIVEVRGKTRVLGDDRLTISPFCWGRRNVANRYL